MLVAGGLVPPLYRLSEASLIISMGYATAVLLLGTVLLQCKVSPHMLLLANIADQTAMKRAVRSLIRASTHWLRSYV